MEQGPHHEETLDMPWSSCLPHQVGERERWMDGWSEERVRQRARERGSEERKGGGKVREGKGGGWGSCARGADEGAWGEGQSILMILMNRFCQSTWIESIQHG